MREGLRLYNLFPTRAGSIRQWIEHLPRIAAMGFNAVWVNPFHYPGFSGSLYAVKDYFRLNPRFRAGEEGDDDAPLRRFIEAAATQRLRVVMDLVLNHASKDSVLVDLHPDWFARDGAGALVSPAAVDVDEPRRRTVWGDLARFDYGSPRGPEIVAYFADVVRHYLDLGFAGFRCDAAYQVPTPVWNGLIAGAREVSPGVLFCAETLGAPREAVLALAGAGFDYLFNSVKWWDYKSTWLLEQYDSFRAIAPSIGFPESHDTDRLANDLLAAGFAESEIAPRYRLAYAFAAAFSTGVMMPMGFEYGWSRRLDIIGGDDAPEPARFDLGPFIAEVNALKGAVPALNEEGPQALLSAPGEPLVALLRRCRDGADPALVLVNTSGREYHSPALDGLSSADLPPCAVGDDCIEIEPWSVRVLAGAPVPAAEAPVMPAAWRRDGRVQIEDVYPELDGGRYPVKRIIGEMFEVWADLFADGHDDLAAVLRYRPPGGPWCETALSFYDNDRWVGRFRLDRAGLWRYTIESWVDRFASWRAGFEKKRAAGDVPALELAEGRALVAAALPMAGSEDGLLIRRVLQAFDAAGPEVRGTVLTSPALREAMRRAASRSEAVRYPHELEIVVDREAARFAAWYEMFPRSQGREPGKSASFEDCIGRLDEIAQLGFDVVYLPPIHPIGRTNRKGRNNAGTAGPGEPGSPWAIGAAEGGHRAIHPELGTLADFRRFVAAARGLGVEVALDFAVQCAPDHQWVKEHPQWFRFRMDGTIKYAENPPKKYEDIVNVDFAGADWQSLWCELRDVVLFWLDEGVRIFRVDNPHTKPLPFWEWLIREVKARCPEAIFLSEAFTRPKMMRALAKAGFSQSYTYFTWRNSRDELTEYLLELTEGPTKEYFRPNFFTNTPDILPFFLQEGSRAAFRIRLVLAATLSSAYGIYSGFELCEASALPDREEYRDSEKYQYKVWDWDRPGHIKDDIRILNRFRHDNKAMRELTNLRFLDSADPNILAYRKLSADRTNCVVAIVNLDPFTRHEGEVELPIGELGQPPDAEFVLEEAFTGRREPCRAVRRRFSLDPLKNPAALFRLVPVVTR